MRVTKAMLVQAVKDAIEFKRLPCKAVSPAAERRLRDKRGFIPAAQYGFAMSIVMVAYELGTCNQIRYRQRSRKGERRGN